MFTVEIKRSIKVSMEADIKEDGRQGWEDMKFEVGRKSACLCQSLLMSSLLCVFVYKYLWWSFHQQMHVGLFFLFFFIFLCFILFFLIFHIFLSLYISLCVCMCMRVFFFSSFSLLLFIHHHIFYFITFFLFCHVCASSSCFILALFPTTTYSSSLLVVSSSTFTFLCNANKSYLILSFCISIDELGLSKLRLVPMRSS